MSRTLLNILSLENETTEQSLNLKETSSMAADFEEPKKRGKRKRDQTHPKLISGEKVEVRSFEEGFLGSWHSCEVIHHKKSFRRVRYDHVLCDDGSSSLSELVPVSPLIDGVKPARWEPSNHRGAIRPLPPSLGFMKSSLQYGQCVDSFLNDAWWEGVIFDHEDGSKERKVFFPDQGDDMMVCVDNLRITQDWDELTEEWKPRGNWTFLELIKEVKQELPLFVSVKQIWYEVREKNGNNDPKEWTFPARDYWRELVSQVIFDNLKLTVDQFLGLLNSSERFVQEGPLLEFSESVLSSIFRPETFVNNSLSLLPFTESSCKLVDNNGVLPDNIHVSCHEIVKNEPVPEEFMPIGEVEVSFPSHDETQPLPLSTLPILSHTGIEASGSLLDDDGEKTQVPSEKLKSSRKRRGTLEWLPLSLEAEFCPHAITQFKRVLKLKLKQTAALILKVRKHLLYLGWKIEYVNDDCPARLRYFSPSGKLSMSLRQACDELETETVPESLSITTLCSSPDEFTSCSSPDESTSCPPPACRVRCNTSSEVVIDSEYCPQAVSDYITASQKETSFLIEKSQAQLCYEAKKHLVFSGWKVFNYSARGKTQLRYVSPSGKSYYALTAACKRYLEESAFRPDTYPTENSRLENDSSANLATGMSPSKEKVQPGDVEVIKPRKSRTKRKLSFHETRLDVGDVTDTKSSTRLLRSSKRARQVALSSSQQTPRTILSWLIDNDVVVPDTIVRYYERIDGTPLKEGKITRDGIKCNCCQEVYSLSNFETHAGSTNHRPSANIILEDGRSLLECQLELKHKKSVKNSKPEPHSGQGSRLLNKNDHICSICHDGGELILCDQCPSSFHMNCLDIKDIPDGDWFCPSCCCGICDQSRSSKSGSQVRDNYILCCYQCGHQYHLGCMRDKSFLKLDDNNYPIGKWFCNRSCERIFLGLRQLLGKPIPVGTDKLTWTLLKYIRPNDSYIDAPDDNEYITENYGKLNVALSVMHECFDPIKESRTRRDLMEDVIFSRWSDLNRLNFQGFYTVVLERNDELITVATVRVHDEKVAEIPLVATRFQYRRLGMCRILMNELEKKLVELGVERLVLPAVSSALDTWTTSFGFSVMKESERLNFLKYTFLDFHGTTMCEKMLKNIPFLDSSVSADPQSFNQINSGNADLDENIAISEVFQAEKFDGSETIDEASLDPTGGRGSGENNDNVPAPLVLVFKPTLAHYPAKLPLDYSAEQKEDEKNAEAALFKCYQRRRMFQPGEDQPMMDHRFVHKFSLS